MVLSGGEVSCIVTPEGESWQYEGGPSGLATAGSGDVKAGIIAGLMARGAVPAQAAAWPPGRTDAPEGDWSGRRPSFLARDLFHAIPRELAGLESSYRPTPDGPRALAWSRAFRQHGHASG